MTAPPPETALPATPPIIQRADSSKHRLGRSTSLPDCPDGDDGSVRTRRYVAATIPFVGRMGGNQDFVLDRFDTDNDSTLANIPDAAPYMSFRQSLFTLRSFREAEIWRAAVLEGWGTLMVTYLTSYAALSPNVLPDPPTARFGPYNNAAFIGPLIGGVTNAIFIALFVLSFSPGSGGHLNPLITIGTFFARLTSLPRMVLYVAFQTAGAALAGLLLRASLGSRDWKVGGCWLFPNHIPPREALVVEFMACMALLALAFGVGLDPRQKQIFGPALGPTLVGFTLGVISFTTGYTRYGYGGASVNPARCFGVFVGSSFPAWHWIHWAGPLIASVVHGGFYYAFPPYHDAKPTAGKFSSGSDA